VKNGLRNYISWEEGCVHPSDVRPTFANIKSLAGQNAIIISDSDEEERHFGIFRNFDLNIFSTASPNMRPLLFPVYSVASSMVFAACMKRQEAPGPLLKHFEIARGSVVGSDPAFGNPVQSYTHDQ
jgi:hypothetical protein